MLSKNIFTTVLFIPFVIICNSLAQEINYGLSVGYSRTIPIFDKENNYDNTNPENYFNIMSIVGIRPVKYIFHSI